MADAVPAHRELRAAPCAELVGPFVVPAGRLDELTAHLDAGADVRHLADRGGRRSAGRARRVDADPGSRCAAVEVRPLPTPRPRQQAVARARRGAARRRAGGRRAAALRRRRDEVLDALAARRYRAKFRTGGVRAELFPSAAPSSPRPLPRLRRARRAVQVHRRPAPRRPAHRPAPPASSTTASSTCCSPPRAAGRARRPLTAAERWTATPAAGRGRCGPGRLERRREPGRCSRPSAPAACRARRPTWSTSACCPPGSDTADPTRAGSTCPPTRCSDSTTCPTASSPPADGGPRIGVADRRLRARPGRRAPATRCTPSGVAERVHGPGPAAWADAARAAHRAG